eukprot:symbB.v1.2.005756.t1/scaffold289.1/size287290/1
MKEIFALLDADGSGNIDPKESATHVVFQIKTCWLLVAKYLCTLLAHWLNSIGSYVGPIAVCQFHGRGLGLVATRRINAGDLLLVEDSFALSRTRNAPIAQSTSELVDACSKKIESSATLLHKIVFWCLHSQSDNKSCSYKDADVRKRVFDHYLGQLNSKAMDTEFLSSISQPCLEKQDTIVASIISSNSRKTEHWNPWTLLLDESESLAGLWLAASLFNHSCLGNVVITYGARKESMTLELLHTYVYPFDTVLERQSKLQHIYGFRCCCQRCALEAGLKEVLLTNSSFQTFPMNPQAPHASTASQLADRLQFEIEKFSAARGKGSKGGRSEMTKVVDAFRNCVALVAVVAPSSEYELKYSMMLAQSISRWALSVPPGSKLPPADELKEALKHAEEAHSRLYGGGGRHFVMRMKKRLEDVYAALRREIRMQMQALGFEADNTTIYQLISDMEPRKKSGVLLL